MKKLLLAILALLVIAPANAQNKKHNFALSFETSDYSYKEPSIEYPPHWTGTMYGVSAKYTGRGLFSDSAEDYPLDDLGDSGYRRESTYIYLPVGFNLKQDFSKGWSLSANGQLDVLLSGKQASKGIAEVDIHNDQEEGYGLRGSVKLEKQFDKFGIFVEPFIRYWHIQNSEEVLISDAYYVYSFIEPKNETREYGLKVGITF